MQLAEKYRPKDWQDVVGQDAIRDLLAEKDAAGQLAGRAYWFSGPSGNGKTTFARLIASKVSNRLNTMETDAGLLSVATLRNIKEDLCYAPMDCQAKAFIINEAHGLRKDCVRMLLELLEYPLLSDHVVWIFTTTLEGQMHFEDAQIDASPLLSRCLHLRLKQKGIGKEIAQRLREIAQAENLDGRPLKAYTDLLYDVGGMNMRAALQEIEAGRMKA